MPNFADDMRARRLYGYPQSFLQQVMNKYGGPQMQEKHLLELLNFFKGYRSYYMESASAHTDSACYHKRIARTAAYLASVVDELAATWDARTQPHNHLPAPWSMDLHGSVDVKAFYVVRPRFNQQRLYNGKYGAHVLKYQFIVDNRATPIDVRGPIDQGQSRFLADNAYVGIGLDKLVCPFKHGSLYDSINGKKRRRTIAFTAFERDFNRVHRKWRSRVEHYLGFLVRFSIFGNRYCGRSPLINPLHRHAVKIITHLDALYLSQNPLNQLPTHDWFPMDFD
eukprot:m51a1_g13086 hypothetical protein (281) ;mRNA; r:522-1540